MKDPLGDRMKLYERLGAPRFLPLLPICLRFDGKRFSRWTRGLQKPFDWRLEMAMDESTRVLVDESNAVVGYTQSDEITLVLVQRDHLQQLAYGGKPLKLLSVLASLLTREFGSMSGNVAVHLRAPLFDGRIWQVPQLEEAANVLLWRQRDAERNATLAAAQASMLTTAEIHGKTCEELRAIPAVAEEIRCNQSPGSRYGRFFQRRKVTRELSDEELEKIPAAHRPAGAVERTEVVTLEVKKRDFGEILALLQHPGP